ncbi:glycosyltransferase family 1 protein [Candidatus Shapirobacteria bacterium CG08_land_8_20_14_0_20_39_18]|uniref:Glycosyltransferase family 1 protein n=1 Tax=Candidatus Shapirobacteria bacterium CG08_land_8_20_14_0_20_39_18 TaxID=1974883 RepID=A0A2M6XDF2_9BACT|nr:MAG: glycosyltransferase family 1 protein [Candidatus Shapirobacteria bacterium CG08_land_8_20_14_0_20_39_18]PJE67873.1 MAG: glycosyltransferase family 1 protein [Candidatus Shapirobacteria bacterium CG10_big_fil_rev_8_21_14_0_10_38_8]
MNKQLTIGINANEANLVTNRVGSNQFAFGLLKALAQIKTKHQFVIYLSTPPLEDLPKTSANWTYRVIPLPKFWTQWRLPLDLYFHQPRPDLIFSLGHYGPRFSPVPSLVTIMDLGFLKFPNQFTKKDFYQLKSWTEYSVKQATAVFAISETTKQDIINTYKIRPGKITVIYPGYDKEIFFPKQEPSAQPYLLFLGSLRPSKNLERLIEAFNLLEDKKIQLVLAGKKGWLYESIFQKVKELKLENRVTFTDFVPEKEIPTLMRQAEVFVFPSLYEGFGIPVVEAMACGTPVLVSNAGSLPEVIGNAGVIVNPYKVEEIAKGIKLAIKNQDNLKVKGLVQAKKYDWEKSAQKVMEILEFTHYFGG